MDSTLLRTEKTPTSDLSSSAIGVFPFVDGGKRGSVRTVPDRLTAVVSTWQIEGLAKDQCRCTDGPRFATPVPNLDLEVSTEVRKRLLSHCVDDGIGEGRAK